MPRSPRLPFTGLPLHVVQRGNDRQRSFHDDSDYQVYLQALREAAKRHHVLVHAYVLMTNHVHLLLTAATDFGISRAMQSIGSRYVRYFNRRHERTGTLWEGRYKACLVASDEHLLAACRYIDLNPLRAGIVQHPLDYPWSSYRALTGRCSADFVTPHEVLAQLGAGAAAYANWCNQLPAAGEIDALRAATAAQSTFSSLTCRIQFESSSIGRKLANAPPAADRNDCR